MRPQRRLIDCVSGVCRTDPEQYDDAVDTGEADEGTEGKDTVQGELILPGTVQVPDHWNGEGKNHEIHQDIEGLVDDDESLCVETRPLDTVVPVGAQGSTLACAGEEDGCAPCGDQNVQAESEFLEAWGCEDATVEADNGDLDAGT